ncbi:hypothetical protein SBI67_14295 [Mycolicibacterium sp. 120266]|nr:hypothetical protein [Mycolicibacterium sp. 120266]MDX1873291.1 hypothetical protein [Mycolicibacterium sp. 120266]
MAGRKRHSAEGKTGEEIAAELGVCRRRRCTTGAAPTAAWIPTPQKELRERKASLKRLRAEAELVKDALREVASQGKF